MFAKAEAEVNAVVAELGEAAPLTMPSTAYFLACVYAYIGRKVEKVGDLKAALAEVKAMMTRDNRTASIFSSGVGTAIAAELIEACKYARSAAPYEGTTYHGHFSDAEVRELGVPLVTGDIPGFVVMIGPAPSAEEAVETVKGYQSRGIFVFLIGGIIDQLNEKGVNMNFGVRVVPVGNEIWSVGHVISLVVRAAMIFGNIQPGDADGFHKYTFERINAFVNAYAPVNDITVACGAGAIKLGFPVITNDTNDMWAVPKSLIIYENTKDWIDTSIEARGIKLKITNIDIPVSFSSAFEGEIIRKGDMQVEVVEGEHLAVALDEPVHTHDVHGAPPRSRAARADSMPPRRSAPSSPILARGTSDKCHVLQGSPAQRPGTIAAWSCSPTRPSYSARAWRGCSRAGLRPPHPPLRRARPRRSPSPSRR